MLEWANARAFVGLLAEEVVCTTSVRDDHVDGNEIWGKIKDSFQVM